MRRILLLMLMLLTICPAAHAEDISIYINGDKAELSAAPYIVNDRTMVPMRGIFEALGAEVSWNGELQRVTAVRGDTETVLTVGADIMYVNGAAVPLDAPAELRYDLTFVPLRAVSEALGCLVSWNGDESRADITDSTVPDYGQLFGTAPRYISKDGKTRAFDAQNPEDAAAEYGVILVKYGFIRTDAGEYSIYTKGKSCILAGVSGGMVLITKL